MPSPPGQCLWPWNLPSSVLKCFTVLSAQPTRICGQRRAGWRGQRGYRPPQLQPGQWPLTCVSPPAPQHRALTASSRRGCPAAVKFAACLRCRFTPAGRGRQSHQSREQATTLLSDARSCHPPFRIPVSVPTHTWFQRASTAAITEPSNRQPHFRRSIASPARAEWDQDQRGSWEFKEPGEYKSPAGCRWFRNTKMKCDICGDL